MTTITWSDGRHRTVANLDDAMKLVQSRYPTAYFNFDGVRWLVWASEADSVNDDGSNAVAEFHVVS